MELNDGVPPGITRLDARIAMAGGTSARIELQPHRLQQSKNHKTCPKLDERDDLIRENGHLRQEIAFYQDARNGMLAFHDQVLEAYRGLQKALKDLSEKLATAEERVEQYWGLPVSGMKEQDMTRI